MYAALKHFHMVTIALSVILFVIRYALMVAKSPALESAFLKRVPHINDAVLLLSGIALIMYTGIIPFTPSAVWLTEKITCVMAYFALGFFALHFGKNQLLRGFAFFGALGWLAMAGKIAMLKVPTFLG